MNISRKILLTAIQFACGAAALASHPNAFAADADVPLETIRYADLDISRPEGAHVLLRRIEKAAHRVCQVPIASDLRAAQMERDCVKKSVANAVESVHSAELTAQLQSSRSLRLASN